MRTLRKPIRRLIGTLCVEVAEDGIRLKGFHKHRWQFASWAQVACVCGSNDLLAQAEILSGERLLISLAACPTMQKPKIVRRRRKPKGGAK